MATSPVVLVVEDNAELRHVLKEALAAEGYQVLSARDEAEALEQLRGTPVNLVISDLPDPPDRSTLQALRQEYPDVPVLALATTSAGHPPLLFAAWKSPQKFRTLPRPFRLRELLEVSRQVIDAAS